jgi:hypothetical protein
MRHSVHSQHGEPALSPIRYRDHERTKFLHAVYELTGGRTGMTTSRQEATVRSGLDINDHEAFEIQQWLDAHRFIDGVSMGGTFGITMHGIDAIETVLREAEARPEEPAETEPAVRAAIFVLEVGPDERAAIERFIGEYVDARLNGTLGIGGRDLAEAEAQVATIQAQMQSPRPRRWIVRIATKALVEVGANAGGNGVWSGVAYLAQKVLHGA